MKPFVNIVMIARNRHRLTRQAIDSLCATIQRDCTITVVDDASDPPIMGCGYFSVLRFPKPVGTIGKLRNAGVRDIASCYRGNYLYFSDNDAYFTPGWLETLIGKFEGFHQDIGPRLGVLGGYNHPYHAPYHVSARQAWGVRLFQSLGAFSMFMPWEHWERFGPFDESANPEKPQSTQGEDVLFCNKVKAAGYLIGATYPFVVLNCGLTSTDGNPCTGAHAVAGEPRWEGVIYE